MPSKNNYGIQLTERNLPYVLHVAERHRMNLDYLKDTLEYNAEEYGEDTYVILSFSEISDDVTFTAQTKPDFEQYWKFVNPSINTCTFRRITPK